MRLALAAPLVLASCFSYPDTSERLDDDIVLTRFDPKASFSSYSTFSIRPDVPLIDGTEPPALIEEGAANALIEAVARNMTARGYVRVMPPATADLGIDLAVTAQLNTRQVCYQYGYGRPYYGSGSYWGYPGYSYYAPWGCATTQWTTGSLLIDVVDLRAAASGAPAPDGGANATLPAIWFAATYRVLNAMGPENVARAVAGIDQAFVQSPYLRAGSGP